MNAPAWFVLAEFQKNSDGASFFADKNLTEKVEK